MRALRSFGRSPWHVALISLALAVPVSGCGGGNTSTSGSGQDDGGGGGATADGASGQPADATLPLDSSGTDSSAEDAADSSTSQDSSGGPDSRGDTGADSSAVSDAEGDSAFGASDSGMPSDASSDSSSEAGEAGPCSVGGAACALDGGNGLCTGGVCAACSDPSDDTACGAAYGEGGPGGHICKAGSCVPGNCRTDADCSGGICGLSTPQFCGGCTTDSQCQNDVSYGPTSLCNTTSHKCALAACTTVGASCSNPSDICCPGASGNSCVPGNCCSDTQCSGSKPACDTSTNTCAACDAPGPGATFVVVDPVNGRDVAGNGRGTVGGNVPDGACAFKTITYALGNLGSGPDGGPSTITDVRVSPTGPVGAATNGEQFPITVPAHVKVEGFGSPVTVNEVVSGDGTATGIAFTLATDGSTLSNLIIDGAMTGVHGVRVTTGSTTATSIVNVEVRNFAGAGIRVELTGRLAIGAGTNAHNNGTTGTELCGLHVTGQAQAVITGGSVPIQFNQNTKSGILVDGAGSVTITGTPGGGANGSVVASGNLVDGIEIHQTLPALNTIGGLVAAGNTQDGARFYGASSIQVRGSVFIGNLNNGVNILPEGAGANQNLLTAIDLGSAASPGGNTFQSATSPNAFAGICLNIVAGQRQTLAAQGNLWEAGDGGVLSCGAAGTLTENSGKTCTGAVDIGGTGLSAVVTAVSNGIDATSCTCVTGAICM